MTTAAAIPKLTIRDLRKTYGPVVALEGASLELREGEFLTLLGPSGSGKTTMLMIIAGLTQPDSGEVWIDGRLATYAPSYRRDIGMVFQNYALFPHLTVYENIAFPLRMRKAPEATIEREVRRVLDLIRLPDVGPRLPRALSGGQQQRIALARCIVYRPSIVLMDEPLGALDKKLRDQMKLEIKHLHTELGITVLYVTHDQEEAMIMSDRVCLMNDARIEQLGTPDELYFRPRTVFAADFLGESNILDATVQGIEGGWATLRAADGAAVGAPSEPGLAAGDRVKFMVRPENVALLGPGESADNAVTAALEEAILVGGVTKHYARLPDGAVVSATSLTSGPLCPVERGATVRLGWPRDRTVVLRDTGATRP
ncbi:MAG TPA: ABC transporter ATP-binding protein [Geminicoccaceae bacterium]|nr:ABC transporter ATP-binding protein [Geminicoccaceae bacterium]